MDNYTVIWKVDGNKVYTTIRTQYCFRVKMFLGWAE